MIYWTLAVRHLLLRPGRALVLLLGYALGVAVMIVLLSVGDAMLDQSRDASLVGGGQLTALPHGIDVEAMRTGGLAGMFFGIDGARFVSRELIGGGRHAAMVQAVSPGLEQKLLTVATHDTAWTVRAGGALPSAAAAAGAGLRLVAGRWADDSGDRAWIDPAPGLLYDEIDHFHLPERPGSDWAEWHYFNVVVSEHEWWYVTFLVGGNVRGTDWGGEVLLTHRMPSGAYQRFRDTIPAALIRFDTVGASVALGGNAVSQSNGTYRVRGSAQGATFDLTITPAPHRYFPPVELGGDGALSGYVVPMLSGSASGRFCVGGSCHEVNRSAAYHDHNWGRWRAATWEWGTGRGAGHALLYGGLNVLTQRASVPFFLALEDSLGVEQVYRFTAVDRIGAQPVTGMPGVEAPESLRIVAARATDTLTLVVRIVDVAASRSPAAGAGRLFLQMRGAWRARGTAAGVPVDDSGTGFFETWIAPPDRPE